MTATVAHRPSRVAGPEPGALQHVVQLEGAGQHDHGGRAAIRATGADEVGDDQHDDAARRRRPRPTAWSRPPPATPAGRPPRPAGPRPPPAPAMAAAGGGGRRSGRRARPVGRRIDGRVRPRCAPPRPVRTARRRSTGRSARFGWCRGRRAGSRRPRPGAPMSSTSSQSAASCPASAVPGRRAPARPPVVVVGSSLHGAPGRMRGTSPVGGSVQWGSSASAARLQRHADSRSRRPLVGLARRWP